MHFDILLFHTLAIHGHKEIIIIAGGIFSTLLIQHNEIFALQPRKSFESSTPRAAR